MICDVLLKYAGIRQTQRAFFLVCGSVQVASMNSSCIKQYLSGLDGRTFFRDAAKHWFEIHAPFTALMYEI